MSTAANTSPARAAFDTELADLPRALRWREWMGRVEAAIFASREPVPREALVKLVGVDCVLDELISDIKDELKSRPYDVLLIAGGWTLRTRPRYADAIRAASALGEPVLSSLSKTESMVLTVVAHFQPVTRAKVSDLLGKDISRDTVARLKRLNLIGAGPRVAQPGAPLTYVTTPVFLSTFGLATLRDLPDIEAVEDRGLFGDDSASDSEQAVPV